jgi:hypothetical protein
MKSGSSIRFSIRLKELTMKRTKYILIPVVVTLVVLVVSLFPSATLNRKASAAPRAAVDTKYLIIPAAAFAVNKGGKDFYNGGAHVEILSGSGGFVAPVYLPRGARIRMIRLYARDINKDYDVCAYLQHTYPKTGGTFHIKTVCTTGSGGIQQPSTYISHYVKWYYGYMMKLHFLGSAGLDTFAVLIKYNVRQ